MPVFSLFLICLLVASRLSTSNAAQLRAIDLTSEQKTLVKRSSMFSKTFGGSSSNNQAPEHSPTPEHSEEEAHSDSSTDVDLDEYLGKKKIISKEELEAEETSQKVLDGWPDWMTPEEIAQRAPGREAERLRRKRMDDERGAYREACLRSSTRSPHSRKKLRQEAREKNAKEEFERRTAYKWPNEEDRASFYRVTGSLEYFDPDLKWVLNELYNIPYITRTQPLIVDWEAEAKDFIARVEANDADLILPVMHFVGPAMTHAENYSRHTHWLGSYLGQKEELLDAHLPADETDRKIMEEAMGAVTEFSYLQQEFQRLYKQARNLVYGHD